MLEEKLRQYDENRQHFVIHYKGVFIYCHRTSEWNDRIRLDVKDKYANIIRSITVPNIDYIPDALQHYSLRPVDTWREKSERYYDDIEYYDDIDW